MSKVHLIDSHGRSASELVRPGEDADFSEMFKLDHIREGQSISILRGLGGDRGVAQLFGVDLKNGVTDDEQADELRRRFGANIPVKKKLTPLYRLILDCLGDLMLQILLVAALVSTIIGIFEEEGNPFEGATIFFAIFLIIGITAGNNYVKERQFAQLQSKLDEAKLQVKRGGRVLQIDSKQLVVGDLLLFNIGDVFNVDGLYLSGSEVKIDESAMTGESDDILKVPYEQVKENDPKQRTPFLISGTKVIDGSGTMLVLRVGENTVQGEMKKLGLAENEPTPLQIKLEAVAESIGKIGTLVAIVTFVILLVRMFIDFGTKDKGFWDQVWSLECLSRVVRFFMIGVTVIVVAVPEGLPLAVTITLAFSVNKMKDERNLVKTLASCEIMGGANNICTDKTGTLTTNSMTVQTLWSQEKSYQNFQLQDYVTTEKRVKDLLAASILYNSNAYPQKNANGTWNQTGNKTECALIQFCDQLGYKLENFRPSDNIKRVIPFNSTRKKMMTIAYADGKIYVFAKGASEILLEQCDQYYSSKGGEVELDQATKAKIRTDVIEYFAGQALRTIAVAFKELDVKADHNFEHFSEEQLDCNLVLLAIAGIKDPLRADVPDAIKQCGRSGIKVRMVTGDNIITAKAIAKECGILQHDHDHEYSVMEGKDFRRITEGLVKRVQDGNEVQEVANMAKFREIEAGLCVLARASPEDKFILVTGLKQLDNVVAVTGDGTNDAPALRKADVGFAMGIAGSDVAKESADIILLDDNFSSIITACKWGRNIYNCIRKFIQFQLTVNVVALFMTVLGAAALEYAPLTSIQMLWVNLIMDTFASLALATEPPTIRLLDRRPYGKRESIVNSIMYRMVIGMSVYQIAVLCLLLFLPDDSLMIDPLNTEDAFKSMDEDCRISMDSERSLQKFTLFFQTFVLMQIFNSINCRKLDETNINPFSNLSSNPLFWVINLIELVVQYLLIFFGGRFANVCDLKWQQHLIALGIGLGSLIAAVFVRMLPVKWFRKINIFEESDVKEEELDQTLPSRLRRLSSIRVGSVLDADSQRKKSIRRQSSIFKN